MIQRLTFQTANILPRCQLLASGCKDVTFVMINTYIFVTIGMLRATLLHEQCTKSQGKELLNHLLARKEQNYDF